MLSAAHCFCNTDNKLFKCKKRGRFLQPSGYDPMRDIKIVYNIQPTQVTYTSDRVTRRLGKLLINTKYKYKSKGEDKYSLKYSEK